MKKIVALLAFLVVIGIFSGCPKKDTSEEKGINDVQINDETESGWEWGTPTPDD